MFWVNGQPASMISLSDRSFQYGDGCFTTILTKEGVVQQWPLHIERMQACLDLLAIKSPDWGQVKAWVDHAALKDTIAGIKLHVSRGEGGRGYNPIGVDSVTTTVSHFSYPSHYLDWQEKGVVLGICGHKLGIMPLLAGHKHNNRLEQILLRREMEHAGYQDGVVMNIYDHVVETTMANLFWSKRDVLYTPSLASSGVAGVARRMILKDAQERGIEVSIGEFSLNHLISADEVFMTNSILGLAPVRKIDRSHFPIGAITRRFQENLNS